jgi:hypothetical protein
MAEGWPALPLGEWHETYDTLHLWTQMVGSVKKRLCPYVDQWWHLALHPTARGLTTGLVPSPTDMFDITFDFVSHELLLATTSGDRRGLSLSSRSVAEFHAELTAMLHSIGVQDAIDNAPEEVPNPIPFADDYTHASYDRAPVERWWRVITNTTLVFQKHRSSFIGKASPVQFFTGSFDLSYTRFSGKSPKAGPEPEEQEIAAGFWPGDDKVPGAAFYSYPIPSEAALSSAANRPRAAHYDVTHGYFVLMYDDARSSQDPAQAISDFLQSSYEAAAAQAGWDRASLERQPPSQ